MTQAFASDMRTARSVLDCASPLALSDGTANDANNLPADGNQLISYRADGHLPTPILIADKSQQINFIVW
jgi:hypothetical protein